MHVNYIHHREFISGLDISWLFFFHSFSSPPLNLSSPPYCFLLFLFLFFFVLFITYSTSVASIYYLIMSFNDIFYFLLWRNSTYKIYTINWLSFGRRTKILSEVLVFCSFSISAYWNVYFYSRERCLSFPQES